VEGGGWGGEGRGKKRVAVSEARSVWELSILGYLIDAIARAGIVPSHRVATMPARDPDVRRDRGRILVPGPDARTVLRTAFRAAMQRDNPHEGLSVRPARLCRIKRLICCTATDSDSMLEAAR